MPDVPIPDAVQALFRCVGVVDLPRRHAAVRDVCARHWPAIRAWFATQGDDLTTHDRSWYEHHFAARLADYVPRAFIAKLSEESRSGGGPANPTTDAPVRVQAADVLAGLTGIVVGQDRACRCAALAVADGADRGMSLLVGPPGTGKSLIASLAARAARRILVTVDLAAWSGVASGRDLVARVLEIAVDGASGPEHRDVRAARAVIVFEHADGLLVPGGGKRAKAVDARLLRILDGEPLEGLATAGWTCIACAVRGGSRGDGDLRPDDPAFPATIRPRIVRAARTVALDLAALTAILQDGRISPWADLLDRVSDDGHRAAAAAALRTPNGAHALRAIAVAVRDHIAFLPDARTIRVDAGVVQAATRVA